MSKSILLPLSQIKFPNTCVVCLSPASKEYSIQQIFTYGRRSHTVTIPVPMCGAHFEAASFKGLAERAVGCLGVVSGAIAGILGFILLFLRWVDGSLLAKILGGVVFGIGMSLIVWWLISLVIAPYFAVRESRAARNGVKITRYIPYQKVVQFTFQNEPMADLVKRASELP